MFSSPLLTSELSLNYPLTIAGDFAKDPSTQHLAFDCEAAALVIRQPQSPSIQLLSQQAVLLEQVLDHGELMSIDPAGEELQEEPESSRKRIHGLQASTRGDRAASSRGLTYHGPTRRR